MVIVKKQRLNNLGIYFLNVRSVIIKKNVSCAKLLGIHIYKCPTLSFTIPGAYLTRQPTNFRTI